GGRRERSSVGPLDEERQRRLGGGLLEPGGSPAEHFSAWRRSRTFADGEPVLSGDLVEVVGADGPPERLPAALAAGYPAAERIRGGLGLVDDCDELPVRRAERHDPVGRAPAGMASAFDRREPVSILQLAGRYHEIVDGDEHVVELEA